MLLSVPKRSSRAKYDCPGAEEKKYLNVSANKMLTKT